MSADGDTVRAAQLYVYWCPRCECQSDRTWHFCKKGPPLIPQMDEETECRRIAVVPVEQRNALAEALRKTYARLSMVVGGLAYDDASTAAVLDALDKLNDICEIPRAALAEAGLE